MAAKQQRTLARQQAVAKSVFPVLAEAWRKAPASDLQVIMLTIWASLAANPFSNIAMPAMSSQGAVAMRDWVQALTAKLNQLPDPDRATNSTDEQEYRDVLAMVVDGLRGAISAWRTAKLIP